MGNLRPGKRRNEFSALYRKGSGGASFSRVGLHGVEDGAGFGWPGEGREGNLRQNQCARSEVYPGGAQQSGMQDVTSLLLLHFLPGGQMRPRPYLPELCFLPPPTPSLTPPQAAVVRPGLLSQTAARDRDRGRLGVLKALVGLAPLGPCPCPSLPRPGHPSLLCHACCTGPFQPLPVPRRPPPSASGLISVSFAWSHLHWNH